ncbi:hypothetical protein F2Q70_00002685 [Brassica cretica]|uniref:Uncharacterized protein n=1 Tax=Brassica cretica TaxID=69181 RepID=A0A8S9IQE2_BRACR|nr:hypothetical protein F2Q70_00002685 [Brassica cretica]
MQNGNSIVASFRAAEYEIPTELRAQKGLKVKNPHVPKNMTSGSKDSASYQRPQGSKRDPRVQDIGDQPRVSRSEGFRESRHPKFHDFLDDLKISGPSGPEHLEEPASKAVKRTSNDMATKIGANRKTYGPKGLQVQKTPDRSTNKHLRKMQIQKAFLRSHSRAIV